ncbi:MAG: diguanylate cyclase [Gammaproteobacteria bacterium]|nr:diguanylate cyclase [Gammaproteobacteria bacterium]
MHSTANGLYQNSTQQNAKALQSLMDVLRTDPVLISALAKQDRQRLLKRASTIYQDLNRHYGVTHFYFSGANRVNLLRVHKPEKYGDTINRQTTLTAQKGGTDAYGVELGPLGTLTLRYVQPWYEEQTQTLLGFVELGMEVDQTVDAIRDLFGIDIFVLINKQYLDQTGWEEGMRTFGRVPDWARFPQMVVSMHGNQLLPEMLSTHIRKIDFSKRTSAFKVHLEHDDKYAVFQPLEDVAGRYVGMMVMLVDTSGLTRQVRESVIAGALAVMVAAIILILFFHWFVGRIGARMGRNEMLLQQLATHDGLTGLFNRRQFNQMLRDAITQHVRYERPLSLLMIDIDHFKQVNDEYGHPAGDKVLIELAKRLTLQSRIIDKVCRYGGEEFVILLPETDSAGALIFAQRLCEVMSAEPVDLGGDSQITVTISIGVASYPDHASTSHALLSAADQALYTAKETGRNRVCSR